MKFIQPDWPAPASIKAYTTTRKAWFGRKQHVDITSSNDMKQDCLAENDCLNSLLYLPQEPYWITQTHSSIVIHATASNKIKTGDASFTTESNQVCVVLTADCLPLLVCNKNGSHVAAIHAGWRGLAGEIIELTVEALQQPAEDLLVWLGPAIGPQKFEVGEDVYQAFIHKNSDYSNGFIPYRDGKFLADIYELARISLKKLGIFNIYGGEFCTYTQEDLFFSYRRDKGKTGRMASLIWISK